MSDNPRLPSHVQSLADQPRVAVAAVAPDAGFRVRAMFGGAGAYAHERMFASLSDVGLALKLPAASQADLLALPGAERLRYDADATPSRHYIVVPPAVREDAALLAPWVRRAIDYVITLPPPTRGSNTAKVRA